MLNIGDRLREERVRLGFNQADFAAIAGVAKTSQFNYEKGERNPDAAYLAAIAEKGADILYALTGRRMPVSADVLDQEEANLLSNYRKLPDDQRDQIRVMIYALVKLRASEG